MFKKFSVLLILTNWEEYKKLTENIFLKNMNISNVIDTRRVLEPNRFTNINLKSFGLGKS